MREEKEGPNIFLDKLCMLQMFAQDATAGL